MIAYERTPLSTWDFVNCFGASLYAPVFRHLSIALILTPLCFDIDTKPKKLGWGWWHRMDWRVGYADGQLHLGGTSRWMS